MKATTARVYPRVSVDGLGVVSHAGTALLRRGPDPAAPGRRRRPAPSRMFAVNAVWLELALAAADLLAFTQTILLSDQPDLARAEWKTIRYRLLHTAARITRGARQVWLRLAEGWPWALALARAFPTLRHIPHPPEPTPRHCRPRHQDTRRPRPPRRASPHGHSRNQSDRHPTGSSETGRPAS